MAGAWRRPIVTAVLVLTGLTPLSARADDWYGAGFYPSSAYSYYPSYAYYAYPSIAYWPTPCWTSPLPVPAIAPPTAFTPRVAEKKVESTVEPEPLRKAIEDKRSELRSEKRAPTVVEGRWPAASAEPAKARCRVGFWNLTGRTVTLTIDGKAQTLGRDRAVTLELPRMFVWQVDQNGEHSERVAESDNTHEVVIRP